MTDNVNIVTPLIESLAYFIENSAEEVKKLAIDSVVEQLQKIIELNEDIDDIEVYSNNNIRIADIFSKVEKYLADIGQEEDRSQKKCCLAIVAIAKDEASYLAEWIEYHLLVGIEKFFVYDNDSTDNTADILAPYVKKGVVRRIIWPGIKQQYPAYRDVVTRFRYESEWFAFIDIDEFIVPLSTATVTDFLRELSPNVAQLLIDWRSFNSSGHITKPEGLVIENYKMRAEKSNHFKCVIKPLSVPLDDIRISNPHWFDNLSGITVNEDNHELVGNLYGYIYGEKRLSQKIVINHYHVKSKEEYFERRSRRRATTGTIVTEDLGVTLEDLFVNVDNCIPNPTASGENQDHYDILDSVMDKYVEPLKKALGMIKQNPLVSVIIPTYNRADVLGRSIESVLSQTYPHFELIIIDDCSTDGTKELVDSYQDERIHYIKNESNLGAGRARNIGVAISRGKYIAFQDSDDVWYQEKISRQLAAFSNDSINNVGMVYCPYRYLVAEDDFIFNGGKFQTEHFSHLLFWPDVGTPTMLISKEAWDDVGGFSEEIKCFEDWEFSIRVAEKYDLICIPEVLCDVYHTKGSVNAEFASRMEAEFYILNEYLPYYNSEQAARVKMDHIIRQSLRPENYQLYLSLFQETIDRMQQLKMFEAIQAMLDVHKSFCN
ncbi:MAG: glycosyltransferase [Lachnospiraceae bacterium]|nr:glycosyltransferase [Lachnospiraceae bacterium]